ncbi:uncharacterized protein LOC131004002 [Salvia miltiorrhiza]|uniref:uncharacterized protein LOC131004002 n=1 Tax=Salvia miltiorrhiza TaxID=226208 RepID=UPI0025AB8CFF|nr:uncharacterized protein LOC131004002 [Salvia miltiorrhiza]
MGTWNDGVWEWNLEWRRILLDREKDQVSTLLSFINNFKLVMGKPDGWKWKLSSDGCFTVKSAFKAICDGVCAPQQKNPALSSIWKAPATHKAKVIAWRMLCGRMATIDNLLKRQVPIPNSETACKLCYLEDEDT